MIDIYGREIEKEETESGSIYRTAGLEIVAESDERALSVFNSMAPAGWEFTEN